MYYQTIDDCGFTGFAVVWTLLGQPGEAIVRGAGPRISMATLACENVPRLYRPQPEQDIHNKAKPKTSKQSLLNLKLPLKPQSKAHSKKAKSEANRPVLDDVSVLARLSSGFAEQRSCGT